MKLLLKIFNILMSHGYFMYEYQRV